MRELTMRSGNRIPVLGQGTWGMGERRAERDTEIAALRHGLDLGLGLIDTAEMYGDGGAEEVIGAAIEGRRDEVFLVSKVFPHNAGERDAIAACERSLSRLGTDRIDLYLLHWRGNVPFAETLEAFTRLRAEGKIRDFGVSNLDAGDLAEFWAQDGGDEIGTDQVLYNLSRRGPEFDLLPWCREHGVPVMAYSPIEQGRLLGSAVLSRVAGRHGVTPAQLAVAWVLHQPGVCAIPKAANPAHVAENAAALDLELTPDDLAELDAEFPPPSAPVPLEIL
ncbi:diketogulonate reductase-like aldo/keto reductase [Prauserella shujinwangii]|uniref:Diketogulonate reductase-like aldo/keto reductase n=1 Tax=Prauserella shujinwangii TaxID=1453103 RepID=A0A2T0M174_9PSEU|nr:aldo/keto reductase [Prauserella shujinwangii]PRX50366.1 diketogulonate reductase-like aldo/keto reductase [Prauserella shujinwangii]